MFFSREKVNNPRRKPSWKIDSEYSITVAVRCSTLCTVNKGTRSPDTITDCQISRASRSRGSNKRLRAPPAGEALSNFSYPKDRPVPSPSLSPRIHSSHCPHEGARLGDRSLASLRNAALSGQFSFTHILLSMLTCYSSIRLHAANRNCKRNT